MPAGRTNTYSERYRVIPPERAAQIYQDARRAITQRITDSAQRRRALSRFDSDPRTQAIRRVAGMQPVTTRRQAVRETARRVIEEQRNAPSVIPRDVRDMGASLIGSANDAFFGLPARAAAGITGTPNEVMQEYARQQGARAPITNILGMIGTSLISGGPIVRGAGRLAAPVFSRISQAASSGNRLARTAQAVGRGASLERGRAVNLAGRTVRVAPTAGQRARNLGRLTAAGSGVGALHAAGTDQDVATGAVLGAASVPITTGGIRAVELITRPVRDVLRLSSASNILRRYTTATRDEIEAAAENYRRRNRGEEPTVFELLPLRDRENLRDVISRMPAAPRERLAAFANERMGEIGPGFSRQVERTTANRSRRNADELAMRLASSRGAAQSSPEEIELAGRALVDPTDMETLARQEASNIMAPFDDMVVARTFNELIPATPVRQGSTIQMTVADEQVAEALRGAAGPTRRRATPEGVSVRDVTDMLSNLRGNQNLPAGVRQRAMAHLEDYLEQQNPAAAQAAMRMNEQFASGMRIAEGSRAGRQTRLREETPGASAAARQEKINAYDTPEGEMGRGMGQPYALARGALQTPAASLRQLDEVADNPTVQEAVSRNLPSEAPAIVASAQDQRQSARALSSLLDPEKMGASPEGVSSENVATMLASLSPAAMNYTRFRGVAAMHRFFQGIPENRANAIVDALFSANPAERNLGLQMLDNPAGRRVSDEIARAARYALVGNVVNREVSDEDTATDPFLENTPTDMETPVSADSEDGPWNDYADESENPDSEEGPWNDYADESENPDSENGPWNDYAGDANIPYGQQIIESIFPDATVTDALRDPDSALGRANPGSYHNLTNGAADVRPIPGMTFEEFISRIRDEGYEIVESRDEVANPTAHATGPHWHVVIR